MGDFVDVCTGGTFAICGLSWFSGLKLPEWFAKVMLLISPSMFGVYIVHECCLKQWQIMSGEIGWIDVILRTVFLFAVSVGVDVLRRLCFTCVSRGWRTFKLQTKNYEL